MPRRENQIDPAGGPLAAFAIELRSLRQRAGGPTYRALATETGISATVLSQAAAGEKLPTWRVTAAYVRACGGDLDTWRERWVGLNTALKATKLSSTDGAMGHTAATGNAQASSTAQATPTAEPTDSTVGQRTGSADLDRILLPEQPAPTGENPTSSVVIDPARIHTREELGRQLTALREQAGQSIRHLSTAVGIPLSTLGDWFSGRTVPQPHQRDVLMVLLNACGVLNQAQVDQWLAAIQRLRRVGPGRGITPYPGLAPFTEEDAQWFFGRDQLVNTILMRLKHLRAAGGGTQLVVGASGSGKSSLLRAGVIPAVLRGGLPGPPPVVVLTKPGAQPTKQLVADLEPWGTLPPTAVADIPGSGHGRGTVNPASPDAPPVTTNLSNGAGASSNHGRRPDPAGQLLVVVDQFEEVFTACTDDAERLAYIAALEALAMGPAAAIVVIALRADFYTAAAGYPELADRLQSDIVLITPMSRDELEDAILRPALTAAVRVEPGLVELLLSDLTESGSHSAARMGALPFLAHALRSTWTNRSGPRMTVESYRATGGIAESIATSAEQAWDEFDPGQRALARRIFLNLVYAAPDTGDTRRRVTLASLVTACGDEPAVVAVLDRFVTSRLITVDADSVEITHEALLHAWPRLRAWLDEDRAGLLVAQQLTAAAQDWIRADRDPSLLYRGPRLLTAQEWAASRPEDDLALADRDFLDASARQARRSTRRRRLMLMVMVILVIIAVTASVVAILEASSAADARKVAESRRLALVAAQLATSDVALADQLALAAFRISPSAEARAALIEATARRPSVRIQGGPGAMSAVAVHPSGTIIAGATEGTVRLWDITDPSRPKPRPDPPAAACQENTSLTFSPNGNLLAASCSTGTIHLWDTRDPTAPTALPSLTDLGTQVNSISFSADSSRMAAAIDERPMGGETAGRVRLWTITGVTPHPLGNPLRLNHALAKSAVMHPTNNYLAVSADDRTVQLWDISSPGHPAARAILPTGSFRANSQLAFSPDGVTLAAGGIDGQVRLWSTTDPNNPVSVESPIDKADSWINAVAFSPDSTTLAIGSSDANKGVRLFDLASRRITATMPHPSAVTSVTFSSDGTRVLTASRDGTARLWPMSSFPLEGLDYSAFATRFSPDGTTLAIGSADLRLFDVAHPQQPKPLGPALSNPDQSSASLAFAPNKRLLAESRGRSGTVQLWDVTNRSRPTPLGPPLQAHQGQVETVAFNSDGTILATGGSSDGEVHLWDIRKPDAPVSLSTPGTFRGNVTEVGFSPDGRLLAAGSVDRTIRLWDVRDPKAPTLIGSPLTPGSDFVYSTVFNPAGTILAAGLADGTVRLYDLADPATPRPIGQLVTDATAGSAYSVAFNSDGTKIAGAFDNGTVGIWSLQNPSTPEHIVTLNGGTKTLYTIAFRPGSDVLAAGGSNKSVRLWVIDTTQAAEYVCANSGYAITNAEWTRYVPDHPYTPPCPNK